MLIKYLPFGDVREYLIIVFNAYLLLCKTNVVGDQRQIVYLTNYFSNNNFSIYIWHFFVLHIQGKIFIYYFHFLRSFTVKMKRFTNYTH